MSQYGNYGGTGASDWWNDVVRGVEQFGNRFVRAYGQAQAPGAALRPAPRVPSPASMPKVSPLSPSASAERGRTAARARTAAAKTTRQAQQFPKAPQVPTRQGGAPTVPGAPDVSSLFAPLFQALEQQRRTANSRYGENVGQIQNIYGQLIGARKEDITDIEEAYKRLQTAAASRGEATLGAMQGREATRLSQNEAVLQSMGVGDIGTTAGDVAAQSAGVAQDVERLNQSNWAGMLDAMGATAQEIARADVTSFGYRQGEDIAALRAAREDYLANVADREFELKFQQQQAKLQAQQEAAANAARIQAAQIRAQQEAAQQQARAEELQYERTTGFLRSADPLSQALGAAALNGQINATQGENVIAAYNDWISKSSVAKNTTTNRAAALADLEKFIGASLSPQEKSVLRTAVSNTFNK